MFAFDCLGEVKRARLEYATTLSRDCFQLFLQIHRVMLDTADVAIVAKAVNIGCSVPSASGGQFISLKQHYIAPTEFGKVVEDGATNDAAAMTTTCA